jgi:outer membrane murein-binding lipoprotein Lpp
MIGKYNVIAIVVGAFVISLAACVSQQKYDALQARYDQLNDVIGDQLEADAYRAARECDQGNCQRSTPLSIGRLANADTSTANYRQNDSNIGTDADNQDYGERLYRQRSDRSWT